MQQFISLTCDLLQAFKLEIFVCPELKTTFSVICKEIPARATDETSCVFLCAIWRNSPFGCQSTNCPCFYLLPPSVAKNIYTQHGGSSVKTTTKKVSWPYCCMQLHMPLQHYAAIQSRKQSKSKPKLMRKRGSQRVSGKASKWTVRCVCRRYPGRKEEWVCRMSWLCSITHKNYPLFYELQAVQPRDSSTGQIALIMTTMIYGSPLQSCLKKMNTIHFHTGQVSFRSKTF